MNKKVIFIFIIFISYINLSYPLNVTAKEKVIIYFFQDKSEEDRYGYLSSIIPGSIAADINRIGEYEAEAFPAKMDYIGRDSSDNDRAYFINLLAGKGKEIQADYFVIGAYTVTGARIRILTQIFDIERQKIIYTEGVENKLSAVMLGMIEEATNIISGELAKASDIKEEEKRKEEEERKQKISPFLGLYNFLSGITFGLDYGMVNLYGNFGDIYKDGDHVSLNLSYELNNIKAVNDTVFFRNIALAGKFGYFSTRKKDPYNGRMQYLEVAGGTLSLSYLFRFSPDFNIAFSAGGGLADMEVYMESDRDENGNVTSPAGTYEDSYHPSAAVSLSMNFYINSLKIESGYSYNIINYSPQLISFSVFYFGFGYRI